MIAREGRFANYSTQSIELFCEYLYDDFEKLVNNTRNNCWLCKQEVICWDKIVQKNGVSNKEDPEMKKINFTNAGKTMKRE